MQSPGLASVTKEKQLCSDALQIAAMTGSSTSTALFTSQVGVGSKSQCLHGAVFSVGHVLCRHQLEHRKS